MIPVSYTHLDVYKRQLVSLFTGLLIGLGAGVNVAVARGLGMGSDEDVERTTHSSAIIDVYKRQTGNLLIACIIQENQIS